MRERSFALHQSSQTAGRLAGHWIQPGALRDSRGHLGKKKSVRIRSPRNDEETSSRNPQTRVRTKRMRARLARIWHLLLGRLAIPSAFLGKEEISSLPGMHRRCRDIAGEMSEPGRSRRRSEARALLRISHQGSRYRNCLNSEIHGRRQSRIGLSSDQLCLRAMERERRSGPCRSRRVRRGRPHFQGGRRSLSIPDQRSLSCSTCSTRGLRNPRCADRRLEGVY